MLDSSDVITTIKLAYAISWVRVRTVQAPIVTICDSQTNEMADHGRDGRRVWSVHDSPLFRCTTCYTPQNITHNI